MSARDRRPVIYIVYYSMYGHIEKLARAELAGLQKAGVSAKLFQVAETLPKEVLEKMHAPPKPSDIPIIRPEQLADADGILFGIPTRFGGVPTQIRALLDATGQLWMSGALHGKFAGVFFSTGSLGGGQETTALSMLPFLAHHGMAYIPIGGKGQRREKDGSSQGGSAWGAGTLSGPDGRRNPSPAELETAENQGFEFGTLLKRLHVK